MKKIYLLGCFALSGFMVNAQTQRTILLEHFTQASCGPCAQYNPAIQTLITDPQNVDKIVSIKYQTSWPGTDPMNAHNPSDVQTRVSLYGVTGVPNSVIDGNVYNGHPADWGQDTIDSRTLVSSPFEMFLTHDFDEGLDSVRLHLTIVAAENVSGANLVAHMAVVESHISFATAPGSNGEKNFYNVMKKMIPNANGTAIGNTFTSGDTIELYGAWAFANVYDMDEIAAIAWVQNLSTKEVYQAVFSEKVPFAAQNTDEAAVKDVFDYPRNTCDGQFGSTVLIKNNGSNNLTSLDVSYAVNGGATSTIAWTGNLGLLETDEVSLPVSYTPGTTDNIVVTISNPNGQTDPLASNDSFSYTMDGAGTYQNYIFMTLQLDKNSYQTSWELIRNSDGAIVSNGGPYFSMSNQKVEKLFVLDDGECYDFKIYDSQGNGLEAGSYYRLRAGNGSYILTGNSFNSEDAISFIADESIALTLDTTGWTGISGDVVQQLTLTPNPTNGLTQISIPGSKVKNVQITNALGQIILDLPANGNTVLDVDLSGYEEGVYFIRAIGAHGVMTRKLIKN